MAINREEKAVVLIVWGGCHNWVSERFGALWMFVLFRLRHCLPRMEMKDMTLWQMLVCCDRKLYHRGTFWRCVPTTDIEGKSARALSSIWSILDMDHNFHILKIFIHLGHGSLFQWRRIGRINSQSWTFRCNNSVL